MKLVVACALLVACREQHTEPPTGEPVKPPRSAAHLTPEAGVSVTPGSISQRLFADGVATDTLALSISIETLGGVSTVIIPRGVQLPVSKTEVFSTAEDNQASVEVHVLQGEHPLAVENRSLGKYVLIDIPPGPRGVPQLEVTFHIDHAGMFVVTARERTSGSPQPMKLTGAPAGPLDKATVERLVEAANQWPTHQRQLAWSAGRQLLEAEIENAKRVLKSAAKLKLVTRKRLEGELVAAEQLYARTTQQDDPKLLSLVYQTLRHTIDVAKQELSKQP